MDNLISKIQKRGVRNSSLNLYRRHLNKIHKFLTGSEFKNMDFVNSHNKDLNEFLNKQSSSVKKNYISSILVGLSPDSKKNPDEKYQDVYNNLSKMLVEEHSNYINSKKENKKNDKESDNWLEWNDILKLKKTLGNELRKRNVKLSNKEINKKNKDLLQQYLVLSLYTDIPPRRNEYADMQIINKSDYNKLNDNDKEDNIYLITNGRNKKKMSFGRSAVKSETENKYNVFDVPSNLNSVINLWLNYHNEKYLLEDSRGNKLTKNGLTKYLNKIFQPLEKSISTSMLRKIFLSHKFKDEAKREKEKEELSRKMNHSKEVQQSIYVKFD